MTKNFLTADANGFALYEGDVVFSKYHNQVVTLGSIWVDIDGEVFLSCDVGTLRVRNAERLPAPDFQERLDDKDLIINQLDDFNNILKNNKVNKFNLDDEKIDQQTLKKMEFLK